MWIYQSDSTGRSLYADAWAYLYNPYVENGQSSYGWFRFGADGAMETGWFTDTDGNRYYLETESSGIKGMALTGWKLIDGKWYYFRGWDGAPYGSLLRGGVTPDGYTVGEDGAWNGQ